jgi:hypothetical protein
MARVVLPIPAASRWVALPCQGGRPWPHAPSKADGSVMTPDLRNLCHLQDMKADAAEQVDAAIRRAISAEPQGNRGNLRSSDHMAVAHFDRKRSEISIRRDGRAV